jgi:hypothetical protein
VLRALGGSVQERLDAGCFLVAVPADWAAHLAAGNEIEAEAKIDGRTYRVVIAQP